MNNVIQIATEAEATAFIRARRARNAIGLAISRNYPGHPWYVDMSGDGTVATIRCPAICGDYGMVLHCNGDTMEIEKKAVRFAGELLERFMASRETADFSRVERDFRGIASRAREGGQ